MTSYEIITLCFAIVCLALSFLFSGMESGVLALNRLRIRQLARRGNRAATLLHGYLENPENFLWTILVGNTIANVAVFGLGAIKLFDWFSGQPHWWLLTFIPAVFIFYVLCELLPKVLFQRFPTRLTLYLARPFRAIHLGLSPLVAVAAWFSQRLLRWTGGKTFTGQLFGNREELRFVIQEASNALTSDEKIMINRVLDLQSIRLRQVMVPLADAMTADADAPLSDALKLAREKNLTRLPAVKKDSGRVVGIINLDRMIFRPDLKPDQPASDYLQPAFFLNEDLRLEDALRRFQTSGHRLAIVTNREHREIGIASLQDILKTIFGEVTL